jgi:splicing factor 3A subunit 3
VSYTEEVKKNASKKRKMEQRQKSGAVAAGKKPSDGEDEEKEEEEGDDEDEETRRKPLEYVAFLHELPNLFDAEKTANLDRSKKFSKAYVSFCEELCEYLVDFLERASPLQFARDVLVKEEIDGEFEKLFERGALKGWEDKGVVASTTGTVKLDLAAIKGIAKGKNASSSKALKSSMNDEEIKDALNKAGLKTGGTPDERCERLFQVIKLVSAAKGGKDDDATIPSKYIRKGVVVGGGADKKDEKAEDRSKTQKEKAKHIARLEYRLKLLFAGALRKTLDNTKSQAEKKLTMSRQEIEREHEEDDDFAFSEGDEDEDEMNKEIYNPLKLPMGWDGKPIPYWLYKLHGLNVEFKCEICGNYSYWGRRAYEQHFTQWRHQHGMRCLNIPFSKAFNEVTTIEEARRLHRSLEEKKVGKWDRKQDQECEDADGNVYNAKTFAELRSQGLI